MFIKKNTWISGLNNSVDCDNIDLRLHKKKEKQVIRTKSLVFYMWKRQVKKKAGLKLNIQKTKIMASGRITSWQTDGKAIETVIDFIFLGSKITADGDYSHEIKRCLFLIRKAMTNLGCKLQSRDIILLTKVHLVKAMVFPVVMYGCESWAIKKSKHWRIDVFELWCWRRLLRVPWAARKSNQSILKEINPEYSLERLIWSWNSNILATWCEELTHLKRPWCWEGLGAGGEGDDRRQDGWMASPTRWTWVCVSSGSWWRTGKPDMLQSMGSQRVGHNWAPEQQQQPWHACVTSKWRNHIGLKRVGKLEER